MKKNITKGEDMGCSIMDIIHEMEKSISTMRDAAIFLTKKEAEKAFDLVHILSSNISICKMAIDFGREEAVYREISKWLKDNERVINSMECISIARIRCAKAS